MTQYSLLSARDRMTQCSLLSAMDFATRRVRISIWAHLLRRENLAFPLRPYPLSPLPLSRWNKRTPDAERFSFGTGSHSVTLAGLELPCRSGCPWTHRPASASWVWEWMCFLADLERWFQNGMEAVRVLVVHCKEGKLLLLEVWERISSWWLLIGYLCYSSLSN